MREIRTSGSMSGDGKRSVAAWPKLPRPSSTLPDETHEPSRQMTVHWGEADSLQMVSAQPSLTQMYGPAMRCKRKRELEYTVLH
jgi:hypothetical protein